MQYETITWRIDERGVGTITLHRPEVHNAFNDLMLEELLGVLEEATKADVRLVVITGSGTSFCAGADLNWMRRVLQFTYEENLEDSRNVSRCFYQLYSLAKPTIAMVNGAAIGGGVGLVAACDIAIAASKARFSLSEVKLGLVPACISPYVLKKVGEGACRELFLSGERFDAERACQLGLVNKVVDADLLEAAVESKVTSLLHGGPEAQRVVKELLEKVGKISLGDAAEYTVGVIASLRMSEEGQEGMAAFLQKRPPAWRIRTHS
jgi:methylglutaconyl-CoA hydratase